MGGLRAVGRWHSKGRPLVYCAPNPAAALLEVLVHLELKEADWPVGYCLLKIRVPENMGLGRLDIESLPADWREDLAYTRGIGDGWLASGKTALLEVPSVIVPETFSVLINSLHPEVRLLAVESIIRHPLDWRLLRQALDKNQR